MDLTHQFLLAMPGLHESWFDNTLSYIFEHDEQGALGFVINRPAPLSVGEIFDQLDITSTNDKTRSDAAFSGGPLEVERGFVLYPSDPSLVFSESTHASDGGNGISLSGSTELLESIATGKGPGQFLFLLGYAGWGPGQLESEIAKNAWLTCDADPDIIFSDGTADKRHLAARSLGIDVSMLSSQVGRA
ncbi:hypothetical protein AB833_00370 [Chromatiales bacterium (ex Bugula neritina AB1)]|nr:hypothetical protein AB833_00370 [Chromatiales bacterium (ex Bugula neritina AB1)]